MRFNLFDIKKERLALFRTFGKEVFGDFGLPINGHALSSQCSQVNSATVSVEGKIEAVVHKSLVLETVRDMGFLQSINSSLFQHSRPNTTLNMGAALTVNDDAFHSSICKKLRKKETAGSGADDTNLRA